MRPRLHQGSISITQLSDNWYRIAADFVTGGLGADIEIMACSGRCCFVRENGGPFSTPVITRVRSAAPPPVKG